MQQKENGLYNYTVSFTDNSNKNTLIFNYERKNEKEVADSLGVSQEDAKAIIEISKNKSKNPLFEDLRNNIDENAQNKNSNISTTLRDIKDNPVANLNMVKNIDDIVIKVVNHQIVAHQNAPLTKNIWLSGVYHSSEYKGNLDYKSDSRGFVGGFDRYLSENIIGGAGYSYIKTDGKIRYTVPQKITAKKDVTVYFRVSDVYKNTTINVLADGEKIISKKKIKLAPGEMESISIKKELLENVKALELGLEV